MHVADAPAPRRPAGGGAATRVLTSLAALAVVAACVAAAQWQQRRMEAKQALRAQLDAAAAAAPVELPAGVSDWAPWRYRPVVATGTFVAPRQMLVDNQVVAGVVGFAVVTPLALTDGRVVLVDRGFVPAGRSRSELPAVAVPAGPVTVTGRIDIPAGGYFELGRDDAGGKLVQHLDPQRFAAATGLPALPIVIEATAATHGDEALDRRRAPPDLGIEKHRIYMVQWYAFAALALGLWIWFGVRPRLRRR
jgi:surfeit locus 1 family protein